MLSAMTTDAPQGRFSRTVVLGSAGTLLLLTVGAYGAVRAMAGPENGPMQLPQGYGVAMEPTNSGMFATLQGCSTSEPVEITIRRIEAVQLEGTDSVEFRVAWPNEENPALIGAGRLPVPQMYGKAEGSTGTLVRCRAHPQRDLDIAVVLPRATTEPVFVHDVAVTYEASGETFRSVADVTLGICVERMPPSTATPDRCRKH